MSNRRSIFSKYFVICSAVILISFICLGAVLLLVSSRYFLEEKKDLLEKNVLSLAEDSKSVMIASPSDWKERVTDKIKEYSMGCNADFILTDKNGGVLISSNYDGTYADVEIPQAMLDSFGSEVAMSTEILTAHLKSSVILSEYPLRLTVRPIICLL